MLSIPSGASRMPIALPRNRSSRSSAGRRASATSGWALTQASSTRSSGPSTAWRPPGSSTSPTPASNAALAGEPAAGVEARRQRARARQADRAMARADAEQAAVACRDAHRSAGVGAKGEVDQTGGDRGGRAATRPAGEPVRRARIDRGAVPDVLAGQAVGEFHRLGLADQPGPRLQQRGHHRSGRVRGGMGARPVGIAVGRDAARDVEQVLHREAEAGQPSAAERPALQARSRDEGSHRVVQCHHSTESRPPAVPFAVSCPALPGPPASG